MDQRVRDRVADWTERPVEGLDGLDALVDEEFSGVVELRTGNAWFAVLNGSILGVHDGRIADFEDAAAVARSAPEPGVALLMAMLAADGQPEERYYTEDTPVSQAHETLGSGGFAGYLELSENVLSGDYYVAYYGEHSAPVAFVGNSERLVTGDEALDRADDEVGIYQVYAVDLDVVDLPGRTTDAAATTDAPGQSSEERADDTADVAANTRRIERPETATDAGAGTRTDAAGTVGTGAEPDTTQTGDAGDGRDRLDDPPSDRSDDADPDTEYGSSTSYGTPPGGRPSGTDLDPEREFYGDATESATGDGAPSGNTADREASTTDREVSTADREVSTADREASTTDRETPSSDGASTGDDGPAGQSSAADTTAPDRESDTSDAGDTPPESPSGGVAHATGDTAEETETAGRAETGSDAAPAVTDDLRDRLADHDHRIAELRERTANLAAADERAREAHEALRAEVEEVAADLSDLRRTVMRLDRTVERLTAEPDATVADHETDAGGDEPAGRDVSPETALAETTLLLRYGSRGAPTLEGAHDDAGVGRAAVEENLRVDVHTPFDDRTTTVDGQPFDEFIRGRIEYRFFEWLVRDLLFEIRETGTQDALRDLYDALPSIDRAELRSRVVVEAADGDREERFDVVVRDAHERPLVVARINASRDPATEEMVVELRDGAGRVGKDADLAAAVSVTESYFSGDAREAAEEATADSILSRNSKESYVKLSRKRGYHLCLVAVGSDEEFHLRVPDL